MIPSFLNTAQGPRHKVENSSVCGNHGNACVIHYPRDVYGGVLLFWTECNTLLLEVDRV